MFLWSAKPVFGHHEPSRPFRVLLLSGWESRKSDESSEPPQVSAFASYHHALRFRRWSILETRSRYFLRARRYASRAWAMNRSSAASLGLP